ncbi:unnamed protein product [Phytomonas sp. Hart1]|nr:unnamed protein product [Phytomonas sp. Hart1]|eukprot:CCW72133.1 unnamed protein product [Phytomonas sp. isolate Hart1]
MEMDDDVEERLQLHSEVMSLRKELELVKEDEARLRVQLRNSKKLVNEFDPQVAKLVSVLEDEAQQSQLHKLWEEECQALNPDEMDWSTIDVTNLNERVYDVRKMYMLASEKADMLYADKDAKINNHTDNREQGKAKLKERFEEDMEGLNELRTRLKQIKDEHLFHQHRGTARVANRNLVSDERKKIDRQNRVGNIEVRTSAKVDALKSSLTELMEECKVLKKQLDESQRISDERKKALEESLKKMQDEGTEARDMRQVLEEEKEELSTLKSDLQGVLFYVRAAKREEEIF